MMAELKTTPAPTNEVRVQLRRRVTCPHCWHVFSPEDVLWVAVHPSLDEDSRVGTGGQRFLPTRFNVDGNALDAEGMVCHDTACPYCHLRIPRPLLEIAPLFLSIAGTPSCGKTYFLASMTWRLRQVLPTEFDLSLTDVDPVSNLVLNDYENQQFFNPDPDKLVKLAKTQVHGDLYDSVMFGDQVVEYPRPFLFATKPNATHLNYQRSSKISRLLCVYDNAGESFEPGEDQVATPVTRHLAHAQVLLFCFDPTQDPRFRRACIERSKDPQIVGNTETRRQEAVFHEMVDRIRRHTGLHQHSKTVRPLIIVLTKFDVWQSLLDVDQLPSPWKQVNGKQVTAVDMKAVEAVSSKARGLLWQYSSELVSAAEAFTDNVLYIPVSATGCGPEADPATGQLLGIRPSEIKPIWAEVPLLVALARWGGGMIPYLKTS